MRFCTTTRIFSRSAEITNSSCSGLRNTSWRFFLNASPEKSKTSSSMSFMMSTSESLSSSSVSSEWLIESISFTNEIIRLLESNAFVRKFFCSGFVGPKSPSINILRPHFVAEREVRSWWAEIDMRSLLTEFWRLSSSFSFKSSSMDWVMGIVYARADCFPNTLWWRWGQVFSIRCLLLWGML